MLFILKNLKKSEIILWSNLISIYWLIFYFDVLYKIRKYNYISEVLLNFIIKRKKIKFVFIMVYMYRWIEICVIVIGRFFVKICKF